MELERAEEKTEIGAQAVHFGFNRISCTAQVIVCLPKVKYSFSLYIWDSQVIKEIRNHFMLRAGFCFLLCALSSYAVLFPEFQKILSLYFNQIFLFP